MWWDFIDDPHGTDTTSTYFVNGNYEIGHGWQRSPNFVNSFDVYTTAQPPVWTGNYTASELLGNQTFHLSSALTFSGLTTDAVGVAFQNYLTWDFENASFKNSYIHNLYFVGSSGYGSYALVGGTSYIYKYTFSTFTPTFEQILPYQGFQGGNYLKDISGPGSVLNDTTADNRKMCIAKFAGECRTGSSAGDVYANLTTSDSTTCNQLSENVPWLGNDWCLAQMSFYGSTLTEIGLTEGNQVGTLANGAPVTDAKNSRILLGIAMGGWRQQAAHPHVVPDGSYAMFETCITDPHMGPLGGFSTDQDNYGCHPMMALIPPQPTADGIDRTNFENVSVSIGPGSGGATHAVVTFGYEENEPTRGTTWPPTIHFYCAQYQGQCYYQSGNYGNTTLANATSLSLNSNQTLPMGVPQRVLFYQVEYLNSSNQVVATDPMQVVAIP
jgi:hypothetical protein